MPARRSTAAQRHIAVDVTGLMLVIVVTATSVQDRDGARALVWRLRASFCTVTLVLADGGYAGKLLAWPHAERTFAWITRSPHRPRL
jgi:hypothetical protein